MLSAIVHRYIALVVIRTSEVLGSVVGGVMFIAGAPWYVSLALILGWMGIHTLLYYFFHDWSAIWDRKKDAEAGSDESRKTDGTQFMICLCIRHE